MSPSPTPGDPWTAAITAPAAGWPAAGSAALGLPRVLVTEKPSEALSLGTRHRGFAGAETVWVDAEAGGRGGQRDARARIAAA